MDKITFSADAMSLKFFKSNKDTLEVIISTRMTEYPKLVEIPVLQADKEYKVTIEKVN